MRTSPHRALRVALLILVAFWMAACGSASDDSAASTSDLSAPRPTRIVLQLDPKLPIAVADRIESLAKSTANGVSVVRVAPTMNRFAEGDHVLAIGDVAAASALVSDADVAALKPEGFIVRSRAENGANIMVARGKDSAEKSHYQRPNRGLLYGAYAALTEMGFGFLHPLAPSKPAQFSVANTSVNKTEGPRWRVRGLHLHTQHPIELANLLNGWGEKSPEDQAGFDRMIPEWSSFLEWMIANRQNRVEWSLLESKSWLAFAMSDQRIQRLGQVVDLAHVWGIDAGADAPMALQQQHAFKLVTKQGELADELASIRSRIDYLMRARFDFLATENGTTEFTHADPARMLAWMNEVTRSMREDHDGRQATIKIHCSTGQEAKGFTDPVTGGPLNVNMLPHYADKDLGVLPHTVQHYGLDDPAPTYGNESFDYMRKFLWQEAGQREVVWHPETAYWVSFDIDVPLFLPVYGERRVHDLRLLANDEKTHHPMDGQMIFSSGWEWGYWLNDVVAARAAWNPHEEAASDEAATRAILDESLTAFGSNRGPVLDSIIAWVHDEKELLIHGRHAPSGLSAPGDIVSRNGQAYIQGWDTWDDVSLMAGHIPGIPAPKTQPDHLGLVEMRNPAHGGPNYTREIEPLNAAMENVFAARATELTNALRNVTGAKELADELSDSARITALRAKQVHGLYDYVDGYWASLNPFSDAGQVRKQRLATARAALDDAAKIVTEREKHYRVPVSRIGGWGNNPTTYEFGYLWTVHSLFYWWRDEGKAVDAPLTPCYQNTINPAEVALGEGSLVDTLRVVREVFSDNSGIGSITACLADPGAEPKFPQDGLRSRP